MIWISRAYVRAFLPSSAPPELAAMPATVVQMTRRTSADVSHVTDRSESPAPRLRRTRRRQSVAG